MRLIIHDGETVLNVTEVAAGWTGGEGQWQPEGGLVALPHETANIGWAIVDGEPAAPSLPAQDLAALKALARKAVITRADLMTAPILSRYPLAERTGWDKREAEARLIVAASDKAAAIAGTLILKALAVAAGENTAATVARAEATVAKAEEFAAISAAVEVMRDAALSAIDAVNDPADMPAVVAAIEANAEAVAIEYGLA